MIDTKKSSSKSKKAPSSMEEVLAMYGGAKRTLIRGEKVIGKVIAKETKRVVMDIGGKGEGVVAEKAFQEAKDFIKGLKVGDEVEASIIVGETPDGISILSLRQAMHDSVWKKLEAAFKDNKPLFVIPRSVSGAGLNVDFEGLHGFVPTTQIGKEASKNPGALVGRPIKVIVIDLERTENKIVFSEKEISDAEDIKLVKKAMKTIKEGDVYEGTVMQIANFGCFVEIEVKVEKEKIKVEGLVHISELSWSKVQSVRDVVLEGDKIKVKVLGVSDGKLSLSVKHAKDDPWQKADEKYKKESKHEGTVVRRTDFGVFVMLEEGIEGLIHMTKIPPGKSFSEGDKVNIIVEEIDSESKKISLGMVLTAKPVGYK